MQGCQVIKTRRYLRAGFLFLGNGRDRLALARGDNRFRHRPVPYAVDSIVLVAISFELGTLIDALVFALRDSEFRSNTPVIVRLEIPDLQLATVNHCERRSLHTADRGHVSPTRTKHPFGDCPRAVDADEPVALAARTRGIGQTGHFRTIAQILKALTNGLRRHRLQPKTLHRVLVFRQLAKLVKNVFSLAPGVAGIDNLINILACYQLFETIKYFL